MAINFPSNPANNQTYTYNGLVWYWANNYSTWLANTQAIGYSGSQGIPGYVVTSGVNIDAEITADDPLAWWKFNEGVGNTVITNYGSLGSGVNLTLSGTWTLGAAKIVPSSNDSFAFCATTTSYAGVANTILGTPATGDHTLEAIVVLTNDGTNSNRIFNISAVGETSATNFQAALNIDTAGSLFDFWEYGSGVNVSLDSNVLVKRGEPIHVVFVKNSTAKTVTYYVNGIKANVVSYANEPAGGGSAYTRIGSNGTDDTSRFSIAHMAVYNKQLSDTRVLQHAKAAGLYSAGYVYSSTIAGYDGSRGSVGFTGSTGVGFTGSVGFVGSLGSVGFTGSIGSLGYTGSIGYTGSVGFVGSVGSVGFTGSIGSLGYTGSTGAGYTGSQGSLGYTGSSGSLGYTGSIGYAGSSAALSVSNYVVQGTLNADQTITADTDTVIQFIDDFDPQNWWNASTYKFEPTIAGYYEVTYHAWWEAPSANTNQYNTQIRKNGSGFSIAQNPKITLSGVSQEQTRIVYMNGTTDSLEFTAYTGGSTQKILSGSGSWFSAALLTNGIGYTGSAGTGGGGGGGASVTISTTAPSSPSAGNLWWNSETGKMFIYYSDANTSQWVEASPPIAAQSSTGKSVAMSIIFGG